MSGATLRTERFALRSLPTGIQPGVVLAALVGFALLGAGIAEVASWRLVALLGVGGALGVALYHAVFGFTSAFRVFLADGQGAGLRAILLMLALAVLLFFPALGVGQVFGMPVRGDAYPLDAALIFGAFLFGVGMQLGGGCASGTLFTVGGGSMRMLLTLVFFIVGSVVGVAHLGWWHSLPAIPAVSLVHAFGWPVALAGNLAVFALLWAVVAAVERRRHGRLEPIVRRGNWLRGPWSLVAGAVALALLNFATLLLAGRPWGITSAFGPWGMKLLLAAGIDASHWGAWATSANQAVLARPVLADITSVEDFGIMLGALLAAGLAGKFAPSLRIDRRQAVASVIGGLLLGYGARLAWGCNIGAFFSGVASGSLHGWVWVACALAGSYVALPLRRLFGMSVERRQAAC